MVSTSQATHICLIEKIQRSFTKHIDGMKDFSHPERLCALKLYSLQRRRDRCIIIYMWKIVGKLVPNLNTPITWKLSERRGRLCDVLSVVPGAVGTKCYHKWHAIRLFNSLPQHLRNLTDCSVHMFKNRLDKYLSTLLDDPTLAYNDNSVNARICETRRRLQRMA